MYHHCVMTMSTYNLIVCQPCDWYMSLSHPTKPYISLSKLKCEPLAMPSAFISAAQLSLVYTACHLKFCAQPDSLGSFRMQYSIVSHHCLSCSPPSYICIPALIKMFGCKPACNMRKEKKRKKHTFWRQFNEKPGVILSCPVNVT